MQRSSELLDQTIEHILLFDYALSRVDSLGTDWAKGIWECWPDPRPFPKIESLRETAYNLTDNLVNETVCGILFPDGIISDLSIVLTPFEADEIKAAFVRGALRWFYQLTQEKQ